MKYAFLVLLLILGGCAADEIGYAFPPTEDVWGEQVDNAPLQRTEPEKELIPKRESIKANTQGWTEAEFQESDYVVLLVSDAQQAAIAKIPEEKTLTLAVDPEVTITVLDVREEQATLRIDAAELEFILGEQKTSSTGISVLLDEVVVR